METKLLPTYAVKDGSSQGIFENAFEEESVKDGLVLKRGKRSASFRLSTKSGSKVSSSRHFLERKEVSLGGTGPQDTSNESIHNDGTGHSIAEYLYQKGEYGI